MKYLKVFFSKNGYDYSKDSKYRSLEYITHHYYSIEYAEKDLERFRHRYEHKGIRIYAAYFNEYYVTLWSYDYKKINIYGSYEKCCQCIDKQLSIIEREKKEKELKKQLKKDKKKNKQYKKVIKILNK